MATEQIWREGLELAKNQEVLKEALSTTHALGDITILDLFELIECLVYMVINAKSIREFPEEVRDELEQGDKDALDYAVNDILNVYRRAIGEHELE